MITLLREEIFARRNVREKKFSREEIFAEEIFAEFNFAILGVNREIKFRETRQNGSFAK